MRRRALLMPVLLSALVLPSLHAQNRPRSLALKDHLLNAGVIDYGRDRSGEELVDIFHLVEDANAGRPVAQHQLGLRYLLGKGFTADTAKAASWIARAAMQNLLPARYNYGILLNNGWGVEWNPFDAFRNFLYAAGRGMKDAQYVLGLMYTDNLVVSRDFTEAHRWIQMAADSGYGPAADLLVEFETNGVLAKIRKEASTGVSRGTGGDARSQADRKPATPLPDFMIDSIRIPDDALLLREALRERDSPPDPELYVADSTSRREIFNAALAGSPEALTLIGRWHETGIGVAMDPVQAAVFYLRAIRFESPRAPLLLDTLIRRSDFFDELKTRVERNDPRGLYVWSGLVASGFDRRITENQALAFLEKAAGDSFPEALVALAMCYFDGRWVAKDHRIARSFLDRARRAGNVEAEIRLLVLDMVEDSSSGLTGDVRALLGRAAGEGSILAQSMLGYCFQHGKGGSVNIPEAVRYYRRAAQRGSQIAFNALRALYDEKRPEDQIFRIREDEEERIWKK